MITKDLSFDYIPTKAPIAMVMSLYYPIIGSKNIFYPISFMSIKNADSLISVIVPLTMTISSSEN